VRQILGKYQITKMSILSGLKNKNNIFELQKKTGTTLKSQYIQNIFLLARNLS